VHIVMSSRLGSFNLFGLTCGQEDQQDTDPAQETNTARFPHSLELS